MVRTTYILDTSVLLSAGSRALFAFPDSLIIVPLAVIEELEKKRNDPIIGHVARDTLRKIEELRIEHGKGLSSGVAIDGGSTVKVEVNHINRDILPKRLQQGGGNDIGILAVAANLQAEGDANVVLLTNDLPLRIKAEVVAGVEARPYSPPRLHQGDLDGLVVADVPSGVVDDLYGGHGDAISYDDLDLSADERQSAHLGFALRSGSQSVLARGNARTGSITKVAKERHPYGVRPRSAPQSLALDYLYDDSVDIVSLGGRAGTGKTMLSIAAGLDQVGEDKFSRVIVFRSLLAVGNQNLGYLPGTEEEKMSPWAAAVEDALDVIVTNHISRQEIMRQELLKVLPITHIRGRTFSDTFLIIDEAQNYERSSLLSILSRLGKGSKAVLCWDAAQSDNLTVSPDDGIKAVVQRFSRESIFAHVSLTKSERSAAAEKASVILEELSAM